MAVPWSVCETYMEIIIYRYSIYVDCLGMEGVGGWYRTGLYATDVNITSPNSVISRCNLFPPSLNLEV